MVNLISINLRHISRYRRQSLVKVLSLASGISCILLYWLYSVEYNERVSGLMDLFSNCSTFDALVILAMLFIVWIGYVLISVEYNKLRLTEIFIRKLYGERTHVVVLSLVTETTILIALSMALSLIVTDQLIPLINSWTAKEVYIRTAIGSRLWVAGGGLFLLLEVFCGFFPAYLSSRVNIPDILRQFDSSE
jgi:putative ABC transport system permease protein